MIARPAEKAVILNDKLDTPPVKITDEKGNETLKDTYSQAFQYIEEQPDNGAKNYTVTALCALEFTEPDIQALKGMKKTGRTLTFTGETSGGGVVQYGACYHVILKGAEAEMPAGYKVTWDQPVKYTGPAGNNAVGLVGNGTSVTFGEKFLAAADTAVTVYGGAASGTCAANAQINIRAGQFEAVYGGNKAGTHKGDATITVDSTGTGEDSITIRRLDGADKGSETKAAGRTVMVSTVGNVTISNICHYDELSVEAKEVKGRDGKRPHRAP